MKSVVIVRSEDTKTIYGVFENDEKADEYIKDLTKNNPNLFDENNRLQKMHWSVR
jgi:hypothetical protein